jgi:hypothetical protein
LLLCFTSFYYTFLLLFDNSSDEASCLDVACELENAGRGDCTSCGYEEDGVIRCKDFGFRISRLSNTFVLS